MCRRVYSYSSSSGDESDSDPEPVPVKVKLAKYISIAEFQSESLTNLYFCVSY